MQKLLKMKYFLILFYLVILLGSISPSFFTLIKKINSCQTAYLVFYSLPNNQFPEGPYFYGHIYVAADYPTPEWEIKRELYNAETGELIERDVHYKMSAAPETGYLWMHDPYGVYKPKVLNVSTLRVVIYFKHQDEDSWTVVFFDEFKINWTAVSGQGLGDPVRIKAVLSGRYRFPNESPALEGKPVFPYSIHLYKNTTETIEIRWRVVDLDTNETYFNFLYEMKSQWDSAYLEIKDAVEKIYNLRIEIYVNQTLVDWVNYEADATTTYTATPTYYDGLLEGGGGKYLVEPYQPKPPKGKP